MSDDEYSNSDSDNGSVTSENEESNKKIGGDSDSDSDHGSDDNSTTSSDNGGGDEDQYGGGEEDDADPDEDEDEDDADDDDNEENAYDEDDEDDENGGTSKAAAVPTKKQTKPKKTTQLKFDYDDEEDEYEENYLQKFDNELNRNYISEFHPECLNHSSDEIEKLATVVRDEYNNIIDPLHKTLPYLTKYEKARILGQRAKQIETGAKPLVKVPENIIDGYIIAELELREKKVPFIIKRPIPGGAFEYWHLRDLENIHF